MGKLIVDSELNANENLKKVLEEKYSEFICEVTYDDLQQGSKESIIKKIDGYYKTHHDHDSEKKQIGKVWALVRYNNGSPVRMLQVAQALDKKKNSGFFSELRRNVTEMFEGDNSAKYRRYAKELTPGEELRFYEIKIDEFLLSISSNLEFDYKTAIYEITKDYMAEALLAHYAQVEEWEYWNSGMDKKAYYRLWSDLHDVKD